MFVIFSPDVLNSQTYIYKSCNLADHDGIKGGIIGLYSVWCEILTWYFHFSTLYSASKDQSSPTNNLEIWNLKAARLVVGFSQKKKDTWSVLLLVSLMASHT